MAIAHRKVEIAVRVDESNDISAVGTLGWHSDVDVLATRSYFDRGGVVVLMVTSNSLKACRLLQEAGFHCKTSAVVLVGPLVRPGLAAPIGMELAAAGVDVLCAYAYRMDRDHHYLVFKTSADEHAMQIIETSETIRALTGEELVEDTAQAAEILSGERQHAAWYDNTI